MAARTFGADEPGSLVEFRSGTGRPNSAPKVGPVVINEIHYHPVVAPGPTPAENPTDEFVELHNFADIRMPLFDPLNPENRWQLAEGVEFEFPRGTVIPAHGHVLVVNFDPSGDSVLEASFRNRYGVPSDVQIFGPLGGRLANDSDVVELVRPDPPQKPPHPDAGFVPYLLVEQVAYSDVLPWPVNLELSGHSLQRRAGRDFSNDAVNWKAAPPTPGRPNFVSGSSDLDADGMPDDWETRHGLEPNQASDAMTDADFDGLSNYGEYLCGTDPKDPASHWRILEAGLRAGSVWIRFPAAPMTAYTVQARSRVTGSAWTRVGDIPAGGAARIVEWQDPEPVSGSSGERYYRVVTPPIP